MRTLGTLTGNIAAPSIQAESSYTADSRESAPARAIAASSISAVSLPVNVFCWDGWKLPTSRKGPISASAPCPKRGRGRGVACPSARRARSAPSQANEPSASSARARSSSPSSSSSHGRHSSRSAVVGRFAGGAQRTTAVM